MTIKKESSTLLDTVNEKIAELINNFQNNNLSREQFNIIYLRYNRQLGLALSVMAENDGSSSRDAMSTNAMNNAAMNRADGGAIYHKQSHQLLETLGDFSLSLTDVMPILENAIQSDFPQIVAFNETSLVLLVGDYTRAILVYPRQLKSQYVANLQRFMIDFENANSHILASPNFTNYQLAQPFTCVVKPLKK